MIRHGLLPMALPGSATVMLYVDAHDLCCHQGNKDVWVVAHHLCHFNVQVTCCHCNHVDLSGMVLLGDTMTSGSGLLLWAMFGSMALQQ